MPPGFSFFDRGDDGHARASREGVEFWIPLAFTDAQKSDSARTRYGFLHVGRLRSGATVEQAQAQIDAVHDANVKRFPEFRYAELGMYTAVTPLQEALTRDIRRHSLSAVGRRRLCVAHRGHQHCQSLSRSGAHAGARTRHAALAWGAPVSRSPDN